MTTANALSLTESSGFITAFLFATLIIGTFSGEQVLFYFLLLVLFSMSIINYTKIVYLISGQGMGTGGGGSGSGGAGRK